MQLILRSIVASLILSLILTGCKISPNSGKIPDAPDVKIVEVNGKMATTIAAVILKQKVPNLPDDMGGSGNGRSGNAKGSAPAEPEPKKVETPPPPPPVVETPPPPPAVEMPPPPPVAKTAPPASQVIMETPKILPVVTVWSKPPKTCKPCDRLKHDVGDDNVYDSPGGLIPFAIHDRNGMDPKWVKDILAKPNNKEGYPFIEWTTPSGSWEYQAGWFGLEKFLARYQQSFLKVSAMPMVNEEDGYGSYLPPRSAAPVRRATVYAAWDWPSPGGGKSRNVNDLRWHVQQPPHNLSRQKVDSMSDTEVIRYHDSFHNQFGGDTHSPNAFGGIAVDIPVLQMRAAPRVRVYRGRMMSVQNCPNC